MSFNFLKFGLNFNKNNNKSQDKKLTSLTKEKNKSDKEALINDINNSNSNNNDNDNDNNILFPNCKDIKKRINVLKKKLDAVKNSKNIIEKLKEQKIRIILNKIKVLKEELYEKLKLNASTEVDPLCSFEEIKRICKFKKEFADLIYKHYKYTHPTPIQSAVFKLIADGQNLIANSETGSGKTLAYVIPIIHKLFVAKLKGLKSRSKAIIILPTKELCLQIYNEILIFSNLYTESEVKCKYFTKSMFNSIAGNFKNFIENNDILIMTPSKLLDLLKSYGKSLTKRLKYLVLDEADKFFDFGFAEIIDEILFICKDDAEEDTKKGNISKLFFSATLQEEIQELITTNIVNSVKVAIGNSMAPARSIKQKFIYCSNEEGKLIGLRNLFKDKIKTPILMFVEGTNKLKSIFENVKYDIPKTAYLHSKMIKAEREDKINKFRVGDIWVNLKDL